MSYRLHIDIPLSADEEDAISTSQHILAVISHVLKNEDLEDVEKLNYKLQNDEDRGAKNYLIKDAMGHCTNKKGKIELK